MDTLLYTVRIKRRDKVFEVITSRRGLDDLVFTLEECRAVQAYQVLAAGIGVIGQDKFDFSGIVKWTIQPLF